MHPGDALPRQAGALIADLTRAQSASTRAATVRPGRMPCPAPKAQLERGGRARENRSIGIQVCAHTHGGRHMKKPSELRSGVAACALLGIMLIPLLAAPAVAQQQITGTPGSPSATTTIDGRYLPPQPPAFGGEINLEASKSKPWWPPQVAPPKGAPNVLLIMT